VDEYADILGVSPKLVVPDDEATAALQAEQQAIARQQQIEQENLATQSARNLAQSPMDTRNALAEMVGQ
jgi:hypothetical protein